MADMDVTARFRADISDMQSKMQKLDNLYQDSQGKWRNTAGQYASASEKAAAGIEDLGNKAQQAGKKLSTTFQQAGQKVTGVGKTMSLAITAPLVGIGVLAANTSKNFEVSMNTLGVVSGAAATEVEQLRQYALKMGADTVFSANEAATAMVDLAKSGFTPAQIQGGGLAATMALAATEGMALNDAAVTVSNAMSTFGMTADQATTIADALAGGANASTASVSSLTEALRQVGPGAVNAGLNLNETVAVLSAFDAAGIKGSDAGTSLKTMLMRLVPTTKKAADEMKRLNIDFTNADGSFKDVTEVADILQKRLGGLTESQRQQALTTLFGADATRAATVLMTEGATGIQKYLDGTNELGGAQALADARMSGLAGSLEQLSGSLETAALAIGDTLAPVIIKVSDFIRGLTDRFLAMSEGMRTFIVVLGGFAAAAGPVLIGLGMMLRFTSQIMNAYTMMPATLAKVGTAFDALKAKVIALNIASLANPYMLAAVAAIAQLVALAAAVKFVYDRSVEFRQAVADLWDTIKNVASVVGSEIVNAFNVFSEIMGKGSNNAQSFGDVLQKVMKFLGGSFAMQARIAAKMVEHVGQALRVAAKFLEIFNKVVVMVANVVRVAFVQSMQRARDGINFVLDRLGPLGTAFRKVASTIASAFGNIGGFIRSALSNAVSIIESAINAAIRAVNVLIEAYNKLPGVTAISTVGEFAFGGIGGGTNVMAGAARPFEERAAQGGAADYAQGQQDREKEIKQIKDLAGATGSAAAADDKRSKALEKLRGLIRGYVDDLKSSRSALGELAGYTEQQFGEISQIMSALGETGSIGQTISMFDQAAASVTKFFKPFTDVSLFGKKAAGQVKEAMDAVREELRAATQYAIDQFRERERLQGELTRLDEQYAADVSATNSRYDALDKAAQERLAEINAKWDKEIPILQDALNSATEAFEKENGVLQGLIEERNNFTGQIASGFRSFMNDLSFKGGASSIRKQFQRRLTEMRQFTANIRTLVAKGLDPALIQEFVTAGVAGAGKTVKALASASATDIAAINEAQAGLGSEISSFGEYASQEWFQAGIAQQEAIVGPLETAKIAAQAALDQANASRAAEIAAQEAHIESLRVLRQQDLDNLAAKLAADKAAIDAQIATVNANLQTNANNVTNTLNGLQSRLPAGMFEAGKASIDGLIDGFKRKDKDLKKQIKGLSNGVVNTLKQVLGIASPSKVTKGLGQEIAEGLVKGLEGSERMVERAAAGLADAGIPNIAFNPGGPMPAGKGGTVINLTVNAGVGTSGAEVGRQIVDALKQYERRNGPVYAKA